MQQMSSNFESNNDFRHNINNTDHVTTSFFILESLDGFEFIVPIPIKRTQASDR